MPLVLSQRFDEWHRAGHHRASIRGRPLAVVLEELTRLVMRRLRLHQRASRRAAVVTVGACERHQDIERRSHANAPGQDELLCCVGQDTGQVEPPQHPANASPEADRDASGLETLHVDQLADEQSFFQW